MRSNSPKLPSIRGRRKRVCTNPELVLSLCEGQEGSVSLTLHAEELSLLWEWPALGHCMEHSHLRQHDIPMMWLHHIWLPWNGGNLHGSLVEGFFGFLNRPWMSPDGYHNTLKLEAFTLLITVHYEWNYSLFVNYNQILDLLCTLHSASMRAMYYPFSLLLVEVRHCFCSVALACFYSDSHIPGTFPILGIYPAFLEVCIAGKHWLCTIISLSLATFISTHKMWLFYHLV